MSNATSRYSVRRSRTTGTRLGSTDRLAHTDDRPSDSGLISSIAWASVACGRASAINAQTTTANLRIAALHLGMERRQRPSHELSDLALGRDAGGIERACELPVAARQELMHLADVLDLERRGRSRHGRRRGGRNADDPLVLPVGPRLCAEVGALHARRHV